MSVMYPLAITDAASITSLVRMTLYHPSTSVYHPQVETNEDIAVLGGKARNVATEKPVTKLVTDIQGVTSVKNQMTVEEAKIE